MAKAQKPPSTSVTLATSHTDVWYGAGALWKSVTNPTAIATSPDNVSAPWLVTWASITSSATPSRTRINPPHEIGSTENPNSAQIMQIAPNAPGITAPGWKSSNPSPAMPARKSSP